MWHNAVFNYCGFDESFSSSNVNWFVWVCWLISENASENDANETFVWFQEISFAFAVVKTIETLSGPSLILKANRVRF